MKDFEVAPDASVARPDPIAAAGSHDGLTMLRLGETAGVVLGIGFKALCDGVLAALLLVLISPLLVLIAALIWWDGRGERGSALFIQERIGLRGETFRCLKFRTMAVDADGVLADWLERHPEAALEWQRTRKLRKDPRITRIGGFLRRTSLDELPQLVNIVRGEMSFVGPRPIVAREVPRYAEAIAFYYAVRPGLTGLWQVSGRSETSFEERVRLDIAYVTSFSLRRDLHIVWRTIPAVFAARGAY